VAAAGLELRGVRKTYGGLVGVRDLDLTVLLLAGTYIVFLWVVANPTTQSALHYRCCLPSHPC